MDHQASKDPLVHLALQDHREVREQLDKRDRLEILAKEVTQVPLDQVVLQEIRVLKDQLDLVVLQGQPDQEAMLERQVTQVQEVM